MCVISDDCALTEVVNRRIVDIINIILDIAYHTMYIERLSTKYAPEELNRCFMNELPENNRWRDFNFNGDKLYILDTDTGVSVVPDSVYDNMYRIMWNDGTVSEDMYNFTRARENARTYVANH